MKSKVEELTKAIQSEDFGKVVKLTHPKIVRLAGGREKMIAVMRSGLEAMKSKGIGFRSVKVGTPSDPVQAGQELFIVVPYQLEMKVPSGRLLLDSFVIGVSSDQGKTWTFVRGIKDTQKLRQLLPNLPKQLKLPEHK